jgi:hypothetical protein
VSVNEVSRNLTYTIRNTLMSGTSTKNIVPILCMHTDRAYRTYLGWYQHVTHVKPRQRWTDDDYHDEALAYWRQNHRQYPPARLWGIFLL